MRREFPEAPVVGIGGVVIDGSRLLLVRRGQEPLKGEWSIPGGVLELGETLEGGIRREVAEETGLDVTVVSMVDVVDRIVFEHGISAEAAARNPATEGGSPARGVRYHYVLIDFLCAPRGGSLKCGSDAVDVRWVQHEELNSHGIYRLASATIAVIEKGFSMARIGVTGETK